MRRSLPVLTAAALVAFTGCGATAASTSHSAPAALAAASGPATVTPAAASGSSELITTGTGTVSVRPNVMTVEIGVENTASRVSVALKANNTISARVQAALEHNGVKVADIQTVELSVYASTRKGATTYHASDIVSATLHNIKTAGTVLDAALAAAGNAGRLDGVSFSIGSDTSSLATARKRAVASARADADQLAAAGGLTVTGLRSITDQTSPYSYDTSGSVASTAGGSGTSGLLPPLQGGTQDVTVEITAVWSVRG